MSEALPEPIAAARADGRDTLTEAEGKRLLASVGVDTPSFEVCSGVDEAVEAAETVGYPAVVKVSSPDVTHKSEWAGGVGVAVGLDTPDAVRGAVEAIFDAAAERGIEADVLVEAAADLERGTEVIVGGVRDPSFGPVVLTGLGGVFTEIFEDTSHRIAPIDAAEARGMLAELQSAPLLSGYRGSDPADVQRLAEVIVAVGDLVDDHPIAELDVNPVLATTDGVMALDALVVLEER
ncbi:acetate--CoA ligase family protein [Halobellus limi]|uniref:acetate--CoA ligase (ADP-forming) n=1 Tax=Halobellus limi TaxID=699433 RepID=A0A1H6AZ27_9EURY|nr:acetate--CoA ligase family protein [Halobellus limi]QCC47822.1 acetyl-CoA synthetase I subunit beta [Halobellus limi]SEG53644.1 acetyl-CoA synthetase (ADP-forming) [Halobellus limi]